MATTDSLTSGRWAEDPEYKQQTPEAVEGAGTFKLIGQDKYILMYDVYMKGKYQFTETTDLKNFRIIDSDVSMNFHPRHGTVIPITDTELRRLLKRWPSADMGNITAAVNPVIPGFHADPEVMYSHKTDATISTQHPTANQDGVAQTTVATHLPTSQTGLTKVSCSTWHPTRSHGPTATHGHRQSKKNMKTDATATTSISAETPLPEVESRLE